MENGIKMNNLSKKLLDRVREQVENKATLKNYDVVIRKICRYFSGLR